jgi:hypothetical protein
MERNLDKRYPGAALVMQRAAAAYSDVRAKREAIRLDENLSSTGKRGALLEHLAKVAPDLQKQRRAVVAGHAAIDSKRAALRPKFGKTDSAILIAVAAKLAGMKPGEQAGLLLPESGDGDAVCQQAALELPPVLSGVNNHLRGLLETRLQEKHHAPTLVHIADEREAWDIADQAVLSARAALQDAGEFPSPHAFNVWFKKVAPADAAMTPDEKRESEALVADALLVGARGLSYEAFATLRSNIADLGVERLSEL